jgi:DNA-binding NtrC family response regulator
VFKVSFCLALSVSDCRKDYRRGFKMNTFLENKSILIVDDDAAVGNALRVAIEQAGGRVILAHSVDAAFETYRQAPPHAVIADIRLGRSDGYALIKAIRQTDSEYRGLTPVIGITSFASSEDEARAMAAGFNAFIAKPFDSQSVVTVVAKLLNSSRVGLPNRASRGTSKGG